MSDCGGPISFTPETGFFYVVGNKNDLSVLL